MAAAPRPCHDTSAVAFSAKIFKLQRLGTEKRVLEVYIYIWEVTNLDNGTDGGAGVGWPTCASLRKLLQQRERGREPASIWPAAQQQPPVIGRDASTGRAW